MACAQRQALAIWRYSMLRQPQLLLSKVNQLMLYSVAGIYSLSPNLFRLIVSSFCTNTGLEQPTTTKPASTMISKLFHSFINHFLYHFIQLSFSSNSKVTKSIPQ